MDGLEVVAGAETRDCSDSGAESDGFLERQNSRRVSFFGSSHGWAKAVEAQIAVNRPERGISMGKLTDSLQASANRYRELMREALKPNLEPDEELRWFGAVTQFRAPAAVRFLLSWSILLPMFGPLVAMFLQTQWYVGITPGRVLFGRIKRPFQPVPSGVIAVPLVDVTVAPRGRSGADLLVANPKGGLPRKLRLPKGIDIERVQALLQA